ncbi:hypothetical protein C1631_023315, partial [Chryseobacterium phosphatilyticum]
PKPAASLILHGVQSTPDEACEPARERAAGRHGDGFGKRGGKRLGKNFRKRLGTQGTGQRAAGRA